MSKEEDNIVLSSDPLDLAVVGAFPPSCGATSVFYGHTRADSNDSGASVVKLFYEAYVPMALKELKKICGAVRSKWPDVGPIRIAHRLGDVSVGEASVVISASAPRRESCIRGVEFVLEELKAKVPIWKKEFYSNGEAIWKANALPINKVKRKAAAMDKKNVQITASNDEIMRRIDSFAERKRLEVDRNNILEFCNRHYSDENDYSCARTDSVLVRRQGSSSHYRKSKVVNTGATSSCAAPLELSLGTQERLLSLEAHLLPPPTPKPIQKDIFARIKALEDRVLYLEGVSPEYFSNSSRNASSFSSESLADKDNMGFKEERRSELEKILMETNLKIQEMECETIVKKEPE